MQLGTKGHYAVLIMVELAHRDSIVSIATVAACHNLSKAYLEQLFNRLRRAGLVISARGPGGGYRLAREPAAIRVADIVFAVEPIHMTHCGRKDGGAHAQRGCRNGTRCTGHTLWDELGRTIRLFLSHVTLEDVAAERLFGVSESLFCGDKAAKTTPLASQRMAKGSS